MVFLLTRAANSFAFPTMTLDAEPNPSVCFPTSFHDSQPLPTCRLYSLGQARTLALLHNAAHSPHALCHPRSRTRENGSCMSAWGQTQSGAAPSSWPCCRRLPTPPPALPSHPMDCSCSRACQGPLSVPQHCRYACSMLDDGGSPLMSLLEQYQSPSVQQGAWPGSI